MFLPTMISGSLFGAALLFSGVSSPAVVHAQLALQDSQMLQVFLLASAISALVAYVQPNPPRSPSPFSRIVPYSANVLGGFLQGIGMALACADPGIGLVQLGVGLPCGLYFVLGGLFGALFFLAISPALHVPEGQKPKSKAVSTTVHGWLHVSSNTIAILWAALCLATVIALGGWMPLEKIWERPAAGGLAIGAAQVASVVLRGSMVGVSGGYAQAVEWVLAILRGNSRPPTSAAQFSASVAVGAWILARLVSDTLALVQGGGAVTKTSAMFGGLLQILGARIAGGCTSGHGISGLATFGIASFVTVTSISAGGIGLVLMMGS